MEQIQEYKIQQFGKRPLDRARDPNIIKLLQQATDEFNLASIPINNSPKTRTYINDSCSSYSPYKKVLKSDDESVNRQKQRNFSATPSVKQVETQSQLRQLSSQLAIQSQSLLSDGIQNFVEYELQRQLLAFQDQVLQEVYLKFEERLYMTFDCLTEFLALKLRVCLARLGLKVPESIIETQQLDIQQYQSGFIQMLKEQSQKILIDLQQVEEIQQQQSAEMSKKLKEIKVDNFDEGVVQHLQSSFSEICKRLFEQCSNKAQAKIQNECSVIEQKVEDKMEAMMEKMEQEMKNRVEQIIGQCAIHVKEQVQEVNSWIKRKDGVKQNSINVLQQEIAGTQISPQFNPIIQPSLQNVFQQQNFQLKEKINQLKSTLSPKDFNI